MTSTDIEKSNFYRKFKVLRFKKIIYTDRYKLFNVLLSMED